MAWRHRDLAGCSLRAALLISLVTPYVRLACDKADWCMLASCSGLSFRPVNHEQPLSHLSGGAAHIRTHARTHTHTQTRTHARTRQWQRRHRALRQQPSLLRPSPILSDTIHCCCGHYSSQRLGEDTPRRCCSRVATAHGRVASARSHHPRAPPLDHKRVAPRSAGDFTFRAA